MPKTILSEQLKLIFSKDPSAWFDPLSICMDEKNNSLVVCFPHSLFSKWFFENVAEKFEACVKKIFNGCSVKYDFANPHKGGKKNETVKARQTVKKVPEHYKFSNFLVNKKNDFPVAAAKEAVNSSDSPVYNPFVVYGNSGCGKTHLLGAMANAIVEKKPYTDIVYGDISVFEPLSGKKNLPGSVFIIDNAQEISRDAFLQEKLVVMLDKISAEKKMIVFAFDKQPSNLQNISKKLIQRLSSGLILELKKPDVDIRRKYVHLKNEYFGIAISKEHELTIAQRYHDFRSIDGILSRIRAYKENVRQDVDLGEILSKDAYSAVLTTSDIIKETARFFSIPESSIIGKSKDRKSAEARKYAIFIARELLGIPLVQLGAEFGGRDHSSIIYALKNIKKMRDSDKVTNKNITELKQLCLSMNS